MQLKYIQPYLDLIRFDKPIGTWLLLWPCLWGVALAFAEGTFDLSSAEILKIYIGFALGAFLMRSAGCVFNDYVDRDFDKKVARTQNRPIASGKISPRHALLFMAGLCFVALIILLQFNSLTIILGLCAIPLVAIYPFMKRFTWWPQLFLGLAFNWGALMGYAAVTGEITATAVYLYLAGICWTLFYDTIYALQDIEDDLRVGVKSSAIRLGKNLKPFLQAMAGAVIVLLTMAIPQSQLAYVGLALGAALLFWQIMDLKPENPGDALQKFRSNSVFGFIIFACLLAAAH